MKKFFSIFAICLVSILTFSGCGVEGSSVATGIDFVQDIFYVDLNVETTLQYKVYPSTASDVYVSFSTENDESLNTMFVFSNGKIKVTNSRFTSIVVKARLNSFEASCIVKLKEYPNSISFSKESDEVNAGSVYLLPLSGMFSQNRPLESNEFNYKITSSNPSVIKVHNQNSLYVMSTGRRGNSRITVEICDSEGKRVRDLVASIDLTVNNSIEQSFVALGNKYVLTNGSDFQIEASGIGQELELFAYYFDANDFLLDAEYNAFLSSDNVATIEQRDGKKYIRFIASGEVELTVQSNYLDGEGKPVMLKCKLKVRIL